MQAELDGGSEMRRTQNDLPIRFTVFTSTFNRKFTLPRLYQSLKRQTFKNFEWLVIDDGSTDDTGELFANWVSECNTFKIVYKRIENGGKPRAINKGVQLARGQFFFMVDSDDYLLPDALEKMNFWCNEIAEDASFIGVGAARGNPDGKYIKGVAPIVNENGYVDATNLERAQFNLDADMCEAYKTDIFKKFPMAEWPGEKFAPEQIALNDIALAGYKIRWHNDIIYVCEYLETGLTKRSKHLERQNPMGYAMMYNHKLLYHITRKEKFSAACQHIALSLYGKHPGYILKSNCLGYTVLMLPFGIILAIRRWMQYKKVK